MHTTTNTTKENLYRLYVNQKLSTPKIANLINRNKSTVYKWLKKFGIPTRTISESRIKYKKFDFSGDDLEHAYLLGFRTGDLYATTHSQQILVITHTTHPTMVALITKTLGKYGHVSLTPVKIFDSRFAWHVRCYLNKSFSFLVEKPQSIPKGILGDYGKFISFLSAYFDSEGCIVLATREHSFHFRLEILTTDKIIMKDIYSKLVKYGYHPTMTIIDKGDRGFRDGAILVRLSKKHEIIKLLKELHLKHPEKIRKKEFIFQYKNYRDLFKVDKEIKKLRYEIKADVKQFVKLAETNYQSKKRSKNSFS